MMVSSSFRSCFPLSFPSCFGACVSWFDGLSHLLEGIMSSLVFLHLSWLRRCRWDMRLWLILTNHGLFTFLLVETAGVLNILLFKTLS